MFLLILQRLHGSRQAAATVDEHRGVTLIHRHDGAIAQQTAEIQDLACLAADGGNDADSGGLAVHHANGGIVGDQGADDSVANILEEMGLETCGCCGTTACLALLNDAV